MAWFWLLGLSASVTFYNIPFVPWILVLDIVNSHSIQGTTYWYIVKFPSLLAGTIGDIGHNFQAHNQILSIFGLNKLSRAELHSSFCSKLSFD